MTFPFTEDHEDMGMGGIAIDESYGGAGLGDLGRVVVMEELGASLCAIPFLPTCGIVADLINAVGTETAKTQYLPKIASGEVKAVYCDGRDAKLSISSNWGSYRNYFNCCGCQRSRYNARENAGPDPRSQRGRL